MLSESPSNFRSSKIQDIPGQAVRGRSYPQYLAKWDHSLHLEPENPLDHVFQPGSLADPAKTNLLPDGSKVSHLTPKFGSVVQGVQLSTLSDKGKNELALFVAERGVAVFRNQDLAELGPQGVIDYGNYFGPLHIHPATMHPPGFPELHTVYRGPEEEYTLTPGIGHIVHRARKEPYFFICMTPGFTPYFSSSAFNNDANDLHAAKSSIMCNADVRALAKTKIVSSMAGNVEVVGWSSSRADKYAGSQVSFGATMLKGNEGSAKFEYNMVSAIENSRI